MRVQQYYWSQDRDPTPENLHKNTCTLLYVILRSSLCGRNDVAVAVGTYPTLTQALPDVVNAYSSNIFRGLSLRTAVPRFGLFDVLLYSFASKLRDLLLL